jgi:hypothetical protein
MLLVFIFLYMPLFLFLLVLLVLFEPFSARLLLIVSHLLFLQFQVLLLVDFIEKGQTLRVRNVRHLTK